MLNFRIDRRISERYKLTKIDCYDILPILAPAFFGRQPTEYVNERVVVQVVGVVSATWF